MPWWTGTDTCSGNGYCTPIVASGNASYYGATSAPLSSASTAAPSPFNGPTRCVCNPGWVGESDFGVSTSETNCQINLSAIRALWASLLAFSVASYLLGLWLLVETWGRSPQFRRLLTVRGACTNDFVTGIFVMHLIGLPALFVCSALKIADPTLHVGLNWSISVVWFVARSCVYICTHVLGQPYIMNMILGRGETRLANLARANKRLSYICGVLAIGSGLPVLWPLASPQPVDGFNPIAGIGSVLLLAFLLSSSMALSIAQSFYLEARVNATFALLLSGGGAHKDPDFAAKAVRIQGELLNGQNAVRRSMALQVVLYGVLGSVPYMWGALSPSPQRAATFTNAGHTHIRPA